MPCLGYIYPKEAYILLGEPVSSFVYTSPAPLTMATLPWQWKMPAASSQTGVCLGCALQPSGNIFQDSCCNPIHELTGMSCRREPGMRCVKEMEFLTPHSKTDIEGLEHA